MLPHAVTLALGRSRASSAAMDSTHALSFYGWAAALFPRPVPGLAERRIGQQGRLTVHGVVRRVLLPPGRRDNAHAGVVPSLP